LCTRAGGGILPDVTNLLTKIGDGPEGPVLDAATVVLLRERADGFECLMLRKTEAQAFGGLWVFPGGRVETGDGTELDGARRAAVREAAEETGLVIEADVLVPISHWTPPRRAPRRYRTWFFVAPVPEDAAEVVVDGGEIGDHIWVRPADALVRHGRSEIDLLPPTWMTLRRLADQPDVSNALRDAASRPIERFTTDMWRNGDGVPVAVWEGDAAYRPADSDSESEAEAASASAVASTPGPGVDLDSPGPRHRLTMDPEGWRYERG
jgi:8-oxo-dGTP pyrophosphatase MutT (NUDIX family)